MTEPITSPAKSYTRLIIVCVAVVVAVVLLAIIGVLGLLSFRNNDDLHLWQFISQGITPTLAALGALAVATLGARSTARLGVKVDQVQQQTNGHMTKLIDAALTPTVAPVVVPVVSSPVVTDPAVLPADAVAVRAPAPAPEVGQ